jgi:hypothetical protein
VTCSDDGYCGNLGDTAYQKHVYEDAISDFNWKLIGRWTLGELKTIYQAGADISNAVGGVDNMIQLFGNVDFEKRVYKEKNYQGQGSAHHVYLNSNPSKWTIAHELAHGWDDISGHEYSTMLVGITKGYTDKSQAWPSYCGSGDTYSGCNDAGYYYGDIPPHGSDKNFNQYEDFAESFAALIYPERPSKI